MPVLPTGVVSTPRLISHTATYAEPSSPSAVYFLDAQWSDQRLESSLWSDGVVAQFVPGHDYTGIAIGNNASGNVLYAWTSRMER